MPAFDAATSPGEGSGTSTSFAHTCTGSNLYLTAGISHNGGSARTISGTYNSVSMTVKHDGNRVSALDLAAPASGENTVALSWTAGSVTFVPGAVSYTGVDQSTPSETAASANGTSTTPSVDVSTPSSNEFVLGWVGINGGSALTPGTDETERLDSDGAGGGRRLGVFETTATGTTTTVSCTSSNFEDWTFAAWIVNAAAGTTVRRYSLTLTGTG